MSFKQFLDMDGVGGVIPTWQLVRTASMWRDCSGPRFEVAPVAEWGHIAQTLKFVSTEVEPAIGDVEAVSGYRNGELNRCSGGAPRSEEHTSELQSLMRISYAVFCLKKKIHINTHDIYIRYSTFT